MTKRSQVELFEEIRKAQGIVRAPRSELCRRRVRCPPAGCPPGSRVTDPAAPKGGGRAPVSVARPVEADHRRLAGRRRGGAEEAAPHGPAGLSAPDRRARCRHRRIDRAPLRGTTVKARHPVALAQVSCPSPIRSAKKPKSTSARSAFVFCGDGHWPGCSSCGCRPRARASTASMPTRPKRSSSTATSGPSTHFGGVPGRSPL